nr:hypothetical protein HUO10_003318 [Paraburkholderia busanensis]
MDGVTKGAVTGEATGSTGGEGAELTNGGVTGTTGADQGGEGGGQGGAAAGEGGGAEGGDGGEGGAGEGGGAAKVEPKDDDVNKRFSKVTRERDEATRREREANENLRRALDALDRATGGKKPEPKPTTTEPVDDIGAEPEPPIFEDPEQYQRDMAIYTQKVTERAVKMQLRTDRVNQEREAAERAQRTAAEEHGRAWQARRAKALEEMPDYADVAENDSVHISQTMAIAITSSEHGPKVAYYLGQHPELAERISKMQPALQLMELGKLEAQITAPKPVKTSKTPEPIKITTGSGEPQVKSADEMSMEEYAAQRNKRH